MVRLSLVAFVACSMLGLVPVAASAAPPSCPVSITHDTTLHADLDCTGVTSGFAVTIDKAGVTLNLNGFTIQGPAGSDNAVGVYTDHNNVTIANGTIQNFGSEQVYVYGAFRSTVKKVDLIADPADSATGVYVEYGGKNRIRLVSADSFLYGLYFYGSAENAVTHNHLTNNYDAVYSEFEFADRFVHNTIDGGGGTTYGLYDDYSNKNVYRSNSVTNTYDGIYLDCSDYGTTVILNNNSSHNGDDGIYTYYCYNDYGPTGSSLIRGNTANDNGGDGIYDEFSVNARFINNTTNGNSDYGMNLYYPESQAVVGNTANGNQSDSGIYLEDNEALYNVQSLRHNSANGNSDYGIYADYGVPVSRSSGNTAHGNPTDNCFNVVCSS